MMVKKERKKRFFTLTELLIVIIVISILTVIALPVFRKAVQHSRDKEAQSMLRLIAQSEEMYRVESEGFYVDCNNTSDCNDVLDLSIASGASAGWDYNITKTNPPGAAFNAHAKPKSDVVSTKCFHITNGGNDPSEEACP